MSQFWKVRRSGFKSLDIHIEKSIIEKSIIEKFIIEKLLPRKYSSLSLKAVKLLKCHLSRV
jgi:hypothetical protein